MKRRKWIALFLSCVLALFLLAGCGGNAEPQSGASRRFPFLGKNAKAQKTKGRSFSLGLPDPAQAVSLLARSGKVTPLFNAISPF